MNINIRKVDNSLSVAVMPRRNSLKEETRQNMVPLVVNGTPVELDMGFLQTIANGCRPVNDFPGMGALKQLLGDAYSAVFAGEKTNEQAVADLSAGMTELLEDYN